MGGYWLSSMIRREEGLKLLDKNIEGVNLRKHMIGVSAIMKKLAETRGEDMALWEMVGLLHDIDYEKVGDMSRHGLMSADMLKGCLPDEGLNAIRAHNEMTGNQPLTAIDNALVAADAVAGLCVATALMMPHKKLSEVQVSSLVKKFKDPSFARNVDRNRLMYCTRLDLNLEQFLMLSLQGLQEVANELGL